MKTLAGALLLFGQRISTLHVYVESNALMTGLIRRVIPVLLLFPLLSACDEGLKPTPTYVPRGTVSGLITYHNWPPRDSLVDLRLVAFTQFPPLNIVSSVLNGVAVVYPSINDTALVPFYVDSLRYSFQTVAGHYAYLVVAQQFGADIMKDWRVVGQYDLDTNLAVPTAIDVPENGVVSAININVDFKNPPPQPFR
jgi:hypothetical protein